MSVLNQLGKSTLSLQGNKLDPQQHQPNWGYADQTYNDGDLNPELSNLHAVGIPGLSKNGYSVDGDPSDLWIQDFNRPALGGITTPPPPSRLDELDDNAPNNTQASKKGSVVSKIYKSSPGKTYRDSGPTLGRY